MADKLAFRHLRFRPAVWLAANIPRVTQHILDDPSALTERARRFLVEHGSRVQPPDRGQQRDWYTCLDYDGQQVAGPDGGLSRLEEFVARYGGLCFCPERWSCGGNHRGEYCFDPEGSSGWELTDSGDWSAAVGDCEGWPLTLSWLTDRVGIDVTGPENWIADSVANLIESAALGQSIYADASWREAVPERGKRPGWGLENIAASALFGLVPEVVEASSAWNRWHVDDQVAVHGWRATYTADREEVVTAWYRGTDGRQRIEAVVGPLREP